MVSAADTWGAGMGTAHVGAILVAVVGAMEPWGFWIHDAFWALWGLVVIHVTSVAGQDPTTFNRGGLWL